MEETVIEMKGVTEYSEGMAVSLTQTEGVGDSGTPESSWRGHGRLVILAENEGGYNCTQVDLLEVLAWVKANRPDLMACGEGIL